MPSVNFTVKWPNGELIQYYSPSTVIYEYLSKGHSYPAIQFLTLAEEGYLLHQNEYEYVMALHVVQPWTAYPRLNAKLTYSP